MPTVHDSYKSTEPVDYDATKQANADRLAQTAPALLAACEAAEELLSRLWTPNAPTVADLALLRGRLQAVIAAASGAVEAAETAADSESWVDTSHAAQP